MSINLPERNPLTSYDESVSRSALHLALHSGQVPPYPYV